MHKRRRLQEPKSRRGIGRRIRSTLKSNATRSPQSRRLPGQIICNCTGKSRTRRKRGLVRRIRDWNWARKRVTWLTGKSTRTNKERCKKLQPRHIRPPMHSLTKIGKQSRSMLRPRSKPRGKRPRQTLGRSGHHLATLTLRKQLFNDQKRDSNWSTNSNQMMMTLSKPSHYTII